VSYRINMPIKKNQGRPRDPQTEARILQAAIDLLLDGGYAALSIEAIARRAGVGKTTIYRRWRSKAELVYEATFTQVDERCMPDSGDLMADLETLILALVDEFGSPRAIAATPGILADFGSDPAFRDTLRDQFLAPIAEGLEARLKQAELRGQLPPGATGRLIIHALGGTVFYRYVVLGLPMRPDEVRGLVQLVLRGALAT